MCPLKDQLQDEEDRKMTRILSLSFTQKDKVDMIDHEEIKMRVSGSLSY